MKILLILLALLIMIQIFIFKLFDFILDKISVILRTNFSDLML